MATWEDVRRLALALPDTTERATYGGAPAWRVRDKAFVWDRPLSQADLQELGSRAPAGPVLGVQVADEGVKQALLADRPDVFLTTRHFDGYPAVLVDLDAVGEAELRELVVDAWRARAPKRLAEEHAEL